MDGRFIFKILLVVLLATGYVGWQRWSHMQRSAALNNLKIADSGVTVIHFYADW